MNTSIDNKTAHASQDKFRVTSVFYGMIAIIYLVIAVRYPLAIYVNAGHDDGYFMQCAEYIVSGKWLGPYNQMRLIKGPGYSIFLAINRIMGFPITLSTALLFLGACATTVWVLRRAGLGPIWAVCLFALLLFQPATFPIRVLRDWTSTSFAMLAFSGIIYIMIAESCSKWRIGLLGIACGFFVITREDGHWLIPGACVLLVYKAVTLRRQKKPKRHFFTYLAIYLFFALIPPVTVSAINKYVYGTFAVTDFNSRSFKNALHSLYSVSVGENIRHVPVSIKKMNAIFAVSPTFKQLEPYFTGPGLRWTVLGKGYSYSQGEYFSWFMWALREGVASLGKYSSPQEANAFYNSIAQEIHDAHNAGLLICKPGPISFMPPLAKGAWREAIQSIYAAFRIIAYNNKPPTTMKSTDGYIPLNDMWRFLGYPKHYPTGNSITMKGWFYTPDGSWFTLNYEGQTQAVVRRKSPDIAKEFNNTQAMFNRFSIEVDDAKNSIVVFDDPHLSPIQVQNLQLQRNPLSHDDKVFYLDQLSIVNDVTNGTQELIASLAVPYRYINACLWIFGTFGFLAAVVMCFMQKFSCPPTLVIACSLWCVFYARLILLVLVHISSFYAVDPLYMLALWPFLFMASSISLVSFFKVVSGIFRISKVI